MSDGLHQKYRVEKITDPTGKHDRCRYFVLDPRHDPIAREVLAVYATRIGEAGNEVLEMEPIEWLDSTYDGCDHLWRDDLHVEGGCSWIQDDDHDLEYVDCTCGHPADDHESDGCPFTGCGCRREGRAPVVTPPGVTK